MVSAKWLATALVGAFGKISDIWQVLAVRRDPNLLAPECGAGNCSEGAAMLPAYTTLHFEAKWQISWVLSLDARLLNVANRYYEPAAGYQSVGHQAWLGLRREVAGQLPRAESLTRARARRRRACTSGMSLPRDFSFLYGGAQSVPAAAPREVDQPARSKTMPHPAISQSPNPNTSDSRRTSKGEPHGRWKLLRPIL